MNIKQARRAARFLMGDGDFNNEERTNRLAEAITNEKENIMLPHELKRRLRSFVDRCANHNIKTLGEYLINPIIKV